MRARAQYGAALVLAVTLGALYCTEGPTGPTAGTLSVRLANAGSSDRAMLLQIAGTDTSARIDTVQATPGSSYRVFVQRQSVTRWRVIVTGNLSNGVLLSIGVADKDRASAYTSTPNRKAGVLAPIHPGLASGVSWNLPC
ncbi:MAG: hypothetical protein DMD36_03890 [Gemmatimonadetes bacterium]|nr:MAG: hypothetical protein DMD36_03890 [Gemmatimonadota bacterium]